MADAALVLDPTVDDSDLPGTTVDNSTVLQLLVSWREAAWRNAERPAAATTDAERAAVAQQIEDAAALGALLLVEQHRYEGLLNGSAAARNAFCAEHWQPGDTVTP